MVFINIFYDLEGRMSLAYVPARDQNLVVRGRNYRLIGFEKSFKVKSQVAK